MNRQIMHAFGGFHDGFAYRGVGVDDARHVIERRRHLDGGRELARQFRDVLTDREANRLMSEYLARKIRERVHDPDRSW